MDYINNILFSGCKIPAIYVFIIICVQFVMHIVIIAAGKCLKMIYFKMGAVFITLAAYIFMLVQIMNESIGSEVFVFASMIMGATSNSFFEEACKQFDSQIKYKFYVMIAFWVIFIFIYFNCGWEIVKCVSFVMAILVGSSIGLIKKVYMECVKESESNKFSHSDCGK